MARARSASCFRCYSLIVYYTECVIKSLLILRIFSLQMLGIFLYKKNVLLLHGGSYKNIQVAIY